MSYRADSLDDIAQQFEKLASQASVFADRTTATEKKLRNREAVIWRQAASMLRQTQLAAPPTAGMMAAWEELHTALAGDPEELEDRLALSACRFNFEQAANEYCGVLDMAKRAKADEVQTIRESEFTPNLYAK